METKIISYNNPRRMARDKLRLDQLGWKVKETVHVPGRHGCGSCLLAIVFLPLALLGRSSDKWIVTYSRARKLDVVDVESKEI